MEVVHVISYSPLIVVWYLREAMFFVWLDLVILPCLHVVFLWHSFMVAEVATATRALCRPLIDSRYVPQYTFFVPCSSMSSLSSQCLCFSTLS